MRAGRSVTIKEKPVFALKKGRPFYTDDGTEKTAESLLSVYSVNQNNHNAVTVDCCGVDIPCIVDTASEVVVWTEQTYRKLQVKIKL